MATSRIHVDVLSLQNVFCFDHTENIYDYSTTFFVRRDFTLKSQFINKFNQILSAGLIPKWQKEIQKEHSKSVEISIVRSIKMEDFSYVFIFVLIFFIPTSVVMILELVIHNKAHSANATNFWLTLDKIVSGKRYYFLIDKVE